MTSTNRSSLSLHFRTFIAVSIALLLGLAGARTALASDREGPIRVLFLGHESKLHNSGAYAPLLMERFGREGIYFDYYTTPDCLSVETLSHFDAVLLYGNHDTITPAQFDALNGFVESGRGFLPIHSASACFGNDPRFIALVGGRFARHGGEIFKPEIIDKAHPILAGVNAWETWDETYVHDQINEKERTLLMERAEPQHREPWTWVRRQGKGRVFYTASGHDERTWKNQDFQLMLRNAILWSVGEERKAKWLSFLNNRETEKRERSPHVANYEKRTEAITFQHPFSVQGSIERTQTPADMHLEPFASEPNIMKPIALAWDERGRCWVAETSDYPHEVSKDGVGHDRITICEDTNNDGRADKFTTFADKLNIPTSIVLTNGGAIVAQPPRLLFLKDIDGDDKADVREVVMEGWGIGDTHAQANNLHYGYDNWIHGCVGYSGFQGTVGGQQLKFAQGTYRLKPDGSALEFLHQFSNNSWGQSQNAAGDNFGGTANNAPIFFGGIPATAVPPRKLVTTGKRINVVDKAHAITPNYRQVDVLGGYTSAAGSAFIYSENLPPRLQGMSMVTEPTMKIVALMDVRPEGAGYIAKDGFNLLASTDEWMSPVFAEVGPDGAVWVADWQNFIIQHNPTPSQARGGYDAKTGVGGAHENPLRDHARGRIYRVVWKNAKQPTLSSLQGADDVALIRALNHPTQFWRLTAQRLLVEGRKISAAAALRNIVMANSGQVDAIHALWVLQGLGELDSATHRAALTAKDPALRRNAIRALGADEAAAKLFFQTGVGRDPAPSTRLSALVKLGELPTSPEATALASELRDSLQSTRDDWLREGLRLGIWKHIGEEPMKSRPAGPNILPNPGFELAKAALVEGWRLRHYKGEAQWTLSNDHNAAKSGEHTLQVISEQGADTSYFTDISVEPETEYELSAWIRTKDVSGALGALLNVHGTNFKTNAVKGNSDWTRVHTVFNTEHRDRISINLLFGGFGQSSGEAWFDDVQLNAAAIVAEPENQIAGNPKLGEQIFFKHATVSCVLCHTLKGQGSAVGPPLDGIANKFTKEYIHESLVEPGKVLAKGFEALGASPMPPLSLILKAQELADLEAYLQTLK